MKTFYEACYRDWLPLYNGLQQSNQHCALVNKFFNLNEAVDTLKRQNATELYIKDRIISDEINLPCSMLLSESENSLKCLIKSIETKWLLKGEISPGNFVTLKKVRNYKNYHVNTDSKLHIFMKERFSSPYTQMKDKTLLPYYILDLSSILPVLALDIQETDQVLDMCASPGGKSVCIIQLLTSKGHLVSNDSSKQRYNRLNKVSFYLLRVNSWL